MPRSQPFRAVALLILPLTACSVLTPSPGSSDAVTTRSAAATPTSETASVSAPRGSAESAPREPARRGRRAAALSDGNIMAIMLAANDAQVKYAELALAKSQDGDIRKFALMMKFDHESVSGAIKSLATRLEVESENTELSTNHREVAEAKRLAFRDLEGFSFDSAYIANEVEFHRTLLRTIDEVLLPAVKEAEFETLLTAVRPAMTAHLEHAEVAARRMRALP